MCGLQGYEIRSPTMDDAYRVEAIRDMIDRQLDTGGSTEEAARTIVAVLGELDLVRREQADEWFKRLNRSLDDFCHCGRYVAGSCDTCQWRSELDRDLMDALLTGECPAMGE